MHTCIHAHVENKGRKLHGGVHVDYLCFANLFIHRLLMIYIYCHFCMHHISFPLMSLHAERSHQGKNLHNMEFILRSLQRHALRHFAHFSQAQATVRQSDIAKPEGQQSSAEALALVRECVGRACICVCGSGHLCDCVCPCYLHYPFALIRCLLASRRPGCPH